MTDGDWIVGLFNREDAPRPRRVNFAMLGFVGPAQVRDLWTHADLGAMECFQADIPPHGCRILRISAPPVNAPRP